MQESMRFTRSLVATSLSLALVACSSSADVDETDGDASELATEEAPSGFVCDCTSARPGFDDKTGAKNCSYQCDCSVITSSRMTKAPAFEAGPVKTTASSFERWDFGSHICHGQYAYRPTLSSQNWEIKVRFAPFKITHYGTVTYLEETIETSTAVRETIKRTPMAPELRDAIAKKLGVTLAPTPAKGS